MSAVGGSKSELEVLESMTILLGSIEKQSFGILRLYFPAPESHKKASSLSNLGTCLGRPYVMGS